MKSLKVIKENYGNVYMTFGDAVSSKEWFKDKLNPSAHSLKPLHLQELELKEKRNSCSFAQEIVFRQQRLCVVTTFNLISIALTSSIALKTQLRIDTLLEEVAWLKSVLETYGAVVDTTDVEKNVTKALDVHKNIVRIDEQDTVCVIHDEVIPSALNTSKVKGHNLSEKTLSFSVPHIVLQLYVNSVLHYLIGSMILAGVVRKRPGIQRGMCRILFCDCAFTYEFCFFRCFGRGVPFLESSVLV